MKVSLTPELEAWIKEKVASGFYTSSSEVIREALRRLAQGEGREADRLDSLKKDIREGLDSGPSSPLDFDELKDKARKRLKQGR